MCDFGGVKRVVKFNNSRFGVDLGYFSCLWIVLECIFKIWGVVRHQFGGLGCKLIAFWMDSVLCKSILSPNRFKQFKFLTAPWSPWVPSWWIWFPFGSIWGSRIGKIRPPKSNLWPTFGKCQTKFESRVPISICRSQYVNCISSTDAAISAKRSQ